MKLFYVSFFMLALAACSSDGDTPAQVGSDTDAHGCKGSAGYSWCAKTESCERPWELAKQQGFENTPADAL